jgi:hypothetical protein
MRLTFCAACGLTKDLSHQYDLYYDPRDSRDGFYEERLISLCNECGTYALGPKFRGNLWLEERGGGRSTAASLRPQPSGGGSNQCV